MKPTRRQVLVASAGATLIGCGRTELEDQPVDPIDEPEPDPPDDPWEGDDVNALHSKPLFLKANASITSNASAGVNSIALKNPIPAPMEILGISWQITGTFPGFQNIPIAAFGGIVACKLDLGTNPLTNGFVPVWSFGRSEQIQGEAFGPGLTIQLATGEAQTQEQYLWRLPRPLYVPVGGVVTPMFQHRGLIPQGLDVEIGYIARSLPPTYKPKVWCLPYASSFISKNFNTTLIPSFDTDQSTETDLINPFDEPLFLQRFTGRATSFNNASVFGAREGGNALSDEGFSCRMSDSNGRPIIGTTAQSGYVNFRTAFSFVTRSWEMDNGVAMDPHSYYNFYLRYTLPGVLNPFNPFTVQAYTGVVGWREVRS